MFTLNGSNLNDKQIAAIEEPNNIFLVACPGSGKTQTLTYKIALELSNVSDGQKRVAAITYTRRAAEEIQDRIENLGIDTSQLWVGTIHAFCLEWILKPYYIYHSKLEQGFRLVNSYDSEVMISEICSRNPDRKIKYTDCNYYYSSSGIILTCKASKTPYVREVIDEFHKQLEANQQIDFEQLLYFSYEILSNNTSISNIISDLFSYLLIDEYQDTKEIQYAILANLIRASHGSVRTFIVGDPNQAIYGSLGGYAITQHELQQLTTVSFIQMSLDENYRNSDKIIKYFSNFCVNPSATSAAGVDATYPSIITYDKTTHKDDLVEKVSQHIVHSVQNLGIPEQEICVIAPWWTHLAPLTRSLVTRLPQYKFDGPGLVPFSRDIDNYWYKLAKIILTEPSPSMYVRRIRSASDLLYDMELALVDVQSINPKQLLRTINSIVIDEDNGLLFLQSFFEELFIKLEIDFMQYPMLQEHHESFFSSTQDRINRLRRENPYTTDIDSFRKAFKPKNGIRISTIHSVKGGEYDVVISFGLLEDFVPNFNDASIKSAKMMLYVIGSRARKNLHLISENGRITGYNQQKREREPTKVLNRLIYAYD